jgi:multidrug transporter EmrE-like cation transporter
MTTYLVLIVGLDILIKRNSEQTGSSHATPPMLMVCLSEFGKLLVSLLLSARSAIAGAWSPVPPSDTKTKAVCLMMPVALLYGCNNTLIYIALAQVRLDTYAVWRNSSILFSALIWTWVWQRRIEHHRWVAIFLCMLGATLHMLEASLAVKLDWGVSLVLLSAILSAMASCFNEYGMKSPATANLTIDQLNIILYSETLAVLLLANALHGGLPDNVQNVYATMVGIPTGTWCVVYMQVLLGITVSRVLKHADAVAKTIVGCLRDVFVVLLAPLLVWETRLTPFTVGCSMLVALAGALYSFPAEPIPAGKEDI